MLSLKKLVYFFLPVLFLWIGSCAVNPVTGKREFMLLSEQDEIKLGNETDKSIVQMYGIYDDKKIHNYIDKMGQEMVKVSHRPNLKFEFKVMDSPVINAFAVPGGYVYITRGILAYLNNEAELAGVVGHEIGHVTARHSAQQYTKAQFAQIGLGLGSVLSKDFAQYSGLAAQGLGLLFLKFSRDNERQSDDLGVEYSTRVGYDAREMPNFFATLDKMQMEAGGSGLPNWMSTHPNPADRVEDVRKKALKRQMELKPAKLRINRNIFLNTINGLIYGENPRQGFVEEDVFYHPDLKFKFPTPAGWKVTNLPSQVQIVSDDEQAAILFTLASGKTATAAASKFITDNKAKVIDQKDVKVNGFKARKLTTQLSGQSGPLKVLSYFINKDKQVYIFHGFSAENNFAQYESAFSSTMEGFSRLRNRKKLNVKPDRLRIKKTRQAMQLRQALKKFGTPDDKLDEVALLNAMELTDQVAVNTMIKTVERGR